MSGDELFPAVAQAEAPGPETAEERVFRNQPLAARMRPRDLSEFAGQNHILGPGQLLRRAIEADRIQSLIFFGPPGTGKTSLAQIIARQTRSKFERLPVDVQIVPVLACASTRRPSPTSRLLLALTQGSPITVRALGVVHLIGLPMLS